MKNLQKAVDRILEAVKNKERIILYGDADLDGVSSVIITKEAIKGLGGNVCAVYFPDREKEGYGITKTGLGYLKKFKPALLIALDCGISNFKEVKLAKKSGFSVIIIDHHKVLDKLPEADIIVDPKQEGDKYPFKDLAAVGVTFKLLELLLGEKMTESLRKNFLELVALATIADMMPKIEDNRIFIEEGLRYIEDSWRPGIRTLFKADFLEEFDLYGKVSKIISMLNVRDLEKGLPTSFFILTSSSFYDLEEMILRLKEKNKVRKERVGEIIEEIRERNSENGNPIIFEGESDWEYPLISSAASFICRDFKKPTFIFKKLEKESQGTVRVPGDIDSVTLMGRCKKYLLTFGGHAKASGFRIKNENLDKFKKCLIKNYEKNNNIH